MFFQEKIPWRLRKGNTKATIVNHRTSAENDWTETVSDYSCLPVDNSVNKINGNTGFTRHVKIVENITSNVKA